MDPQFEATVHRLVGNLRTLLEGNADELRSSLVVNESTAGRVAC